jgi:hypothetical protein
MVLLFPILVPGGCNSSSPILPPEPEVKYIEVNPIRVTLYPRIWEIETTTGFSATARREDGSAIMTDPLKFEWYTDPPSADGKSLIDENGNFLCGEHTPAGLYLAWASYDGATSPKIQIFVSDSTVYNE